MVVGKQKVFLPSARDIRVTLVLNMCLDAWLEMRGDSLTKDLAGDSIPLLVHKQRSCDRRRSWNPLPRVRIKSLTSVVLIALVASESDFLLAGDHELDRRMLEQEVAEDLFSELRRERGEVVCHLAYQASYAFRTGCELGCGGWTARICSALHGKGGRRDPSRANEPS